MPHDTIFALSSGAGRAGIAVIRISGEAVTSISKSLCGFVPEPRMATVSLIKNVKDETLDQALLLYLQAPNSFTGEDVLELHLHGAPAVVRAVLKELSAQKNCRAAEAGEFTRRAFLNGKKDLTEIEGFSDLLQAETELQRKSALTEALGANRAFYEKTRAEILKILALLEAHIDFSAEEDIPEATLAQAFTAMAGLQNELQNFLDKSQSAERLRDGLNIVLVGAPNAGKSSLLNALAGRDVAIVTDEAGTTRDALEVKLDLSGLPVTLIDTAGLREAQNKVEKIGVARALERAEKADLILWLDAPDVETQMQLPNSNAEKWLVKTKSDLTSSSLRGSKADEAIQLKQKAGSPRSLTPARYDGEVFSHAISLSTQTGQGIDLLLKALTDFAEKVFAIQNEQPLFIQERQRALILECLNALECAQKNKQENLELIAQEMREAATALGRITGHINTEEILGAIFSQFCVGK